MIKTTKLKKLIIQSAAVFALSFFALSSPVYAESEAPAVPATESSSEIQPRSDIIDWRYKTVGGRLYRRLYNYTKDEWAMEYWEECV